MIQLQSGAIVHRLRHGRPPVLPTVDLRRTSRRSTAPNRSPGHRRRCHRPARRPDAARPGAPTGRRRQRAHRRHRARRDRPGRGPRRIQPGADRGGSARPGDSARRRRSARPKRSPTASATGAGPAVVRAGQARHGDRLRRGVATRLHLPAPPSSPPTIRCWWTASSRTRWDRRRRPVRRYRGLPRRDHGAHRGGRGSTRRLSVRPPPVTLGRSDLGRCARPPRRLRHRRAA